MGQRQKDTIMSKVELVAMTHPVGKFIGRSAEEMITDIARVSNPKNQGLPGAKLAAYLIKNRPWSPFEHVFLSFEIKTSRAIGTQLLRHRSFTFQEFSQRYSKVESIEPIEIREQADNNRQSSTDVFNPHIELDNRFGEYSDSAQTLINDCIEMVQFAYAGLIDAGVAKECARMILPMAASTTIYMTGPLRSWIHFLELRLHEHAQKEIQEIGKEIKDTLYEHFPNVFEAIDELKTEKENTEHKAVLFETSIDGQKLALEKQNTIDTLREQLNKYENEDTYTIEQIENYVEKQDSLGNIAYNLNHDKIMEANKNA